MLLRLDKRIRNTLLAGAVLLSPSLASAAAIDFTADQATWGVGGTSITDGILTVSSQGGDITWFTDGMGVSGGTENDEVDNLETMTLTFSSAVFINSITVDDFYLNEGPGGSNEQAVITVNGTDILGFTASKFNGAPPTVLTDAFFDNLAVTQLVLQGAAPNTGVEANDFALAGIDFTIVPTSSVPVPSALWLLAMGGLLLRKGSSFT